MKLYFSPGACSMAAHIVLEEIGAKYEAVKVDLAKKTTPEGDFNQINPKGYVPALKMDNGEVLTEDSVIMQYLADQKPEAGLIPKGGMERYRLLETLHFVSTEIHKGFSPLWAADRIFQDKAAAEQMKKATIDRLHSRFNLVEKMLSEKPYLTGDKFTIADAYLFTVMNWSRVHNLSMSQWPKTEAFLKKVSERPSVQKVLKAEGLLH